MKWFEDLKENSKEFLDKFNFISSIARNFSWWLALGCGVAAAWWGLKNADRPWQVLSTIVTVAFIYTLLRAFSYRRRLKMVQNSFCYLHKLTHQLRDAFNSGSAGIGDGAGINKVLTVPISDNTTAELETMTLLQQVLDNAAHCFREITGVSVTASLIMPGQDNKDGSYLESVLYCSDTDPERARKA